MNRQSTTNERHFRPGQFLFREGELSRSLFLIKKGTVEIRKMKGMTHVELGRLYSNEVLGELSFFDRAPRSASAVALTEVEAIELSFDSLDQIYSQIPDYFKTIIASITNRLRRANELIRTLQKNGVAEGTTEIGSTELSAREALALANEMPQENEKPPTTDPVEMLDLPRTKEEPHE